MWPKCLPPSAVRSIESRINLMKEAHALKPTLTHTDMVREAKKIEAASHKLLKNLRDFEREYFSDACGDNHKRKADLLLKGLDEADLNIARLAYSQYSCQFVLLGLAARMRALQTPGKSGKKDHLGPALKEHIEWVFAKLNLPTGKTNDFVQTLDYAIQLAGIKSSAESLTRSRKNS